MVIGPLCQVTNPDIGVMHGRIQDGRGGGPRQPDTGDDQGGGEGRERHIGYCSHMKKKCVIWNVCKFSL